MRRNLHRFLAFSYRNQLYFFLALPLWSQCGTVYIHKGPDLASTNTLHPRRQYSGVSGRRGVVALPPRPVLRLHVQQAVYRLTIMDFCANMRKSQPEPQTQLQWLGVLWHPQTGHWQASQAIRDRICASTAQLLSSGWVTRRCLKALVGLINFACQIHRHLRVYLEPLTKGSALARPQDRDVPHRIQPQLSQDLEFCRDPTVPSISASLLSLDRCVPGRLRCSSPSPCCGSRSLGVLRLTAPYQRARTTGSPSRHLSVSSVPLPPRRVHRQRDIAFHTHPSHVSLSPPPGGVETSITRRGMPPDFLTPPSHSDGAQRVGGRTQQV